MPFRLLPLALRTRAHPLPTRRGGWEGVPLAAAGVCVVVVEKLEGMKADTSLLEQWELWRRVLDVMC